MRRLLIGFGLALYVATLLWLVVGVPFVFVSPDENAAFTFARMQRAYGTLAMPEGRNLLLDGVLHPRSVVAVGASLLPGSFLGMPVVAGLLGTIVGEFGMQLMTPALIVAALFAWYSIIKKLFGNTTLAVVSAVLFAAHPAVWYYAARPMMHNVAFVCFLVFAAWFAIARPFGSKHIHVRAAAADYFFAGIMVGVALFFRTSEGLWVAGLLVAAVVAMRRSLSRAAFVALAAGLMLMLAVTGFFNAAYFGSPFASGYTIDEPQHSLASSLVPEERLGEVLPSALALLLPFGFHERAIAANVWHFGVALFPWMSVLAVAGMLSVVRGKSNDAWRWLVVVTLGLAVWLAAVYGSWSFNDNPDPAAVTLGDSHVRYWLPLFVLSTPFIAHALMLLAAPCSKRYRATVLAASVAAVVALSGVLVFVDGDGLLHSRRAMASAIEKRSAIFAHTEQDAVVVVDRADKFVWPYRAVIQPLRSETTYTAMPAVAAAAPLYYFGITLPADDMTYLNTVKLAGLGLRIDLVTTVGDESLYRITPVDSV